jgi:hypothetical protein
VASTALILAGELALFEIIGGIMVLSAALLEGSRNEGAGLISVLRRTVYNK